MRARLAIAASGTQTELREVVLRNKPPSMIAASPKATVPVLLPTSGEVIDESRDIMFWALQQNDPQNWLAPWRTDPDKVNALIDQNDGPFKRHLDRYKYPNRYQDEGVTASSERDAALKILQDWNAQIGETGWIIGDNCTIADMALRPFVRQFAHVDRDWFDAQPLPFLQAWLADFLSSDLFKSIMTKFKPWEEGTQGIDFPVPAEA